MSRKHQALSKNEDNRLMYLHALQKWQFLVDNSHLPAGPALHALGKVLPHLCHLLNYCSFCERYRKACNCDRSCPLMIREPYDGTCGCGEDSLYVRWSEAGDSIRRKWWAKRILQIIRWSANQDGFCFGDPELAK